MGLSRNYVSMLEQGREPSAMVKSRIQELEEQWANSGAIVGSARETVQRAMRAKKMTFADLSKVTGYSAGVLEAVIEGNGRASERMIEKICSALELEKETLMSGSDSPTVREEGIGTYGAKPPIRTPPGTNVRYVPLLSMAQAGSQLDFAFSDGAYDYEGVPAFNVKDPRAFAVRIAGDSMQPKFQEGDVVIVSPAKQPHHGDCVLAKLGERENGGVVFKLYTSRDAGRRVILSSYNPAHQPIELERENVVWIYPAVSMIRPLNHNL